MQPPPWYIREDLVPPALERAETLDSQDRIFGYTPATTSTHAIRGSENIPSHWWDTCAVPSVLARLMEDVCKTVPLLLREMAAPCPNPANHYDRLSSAIQLMAHLLSTRSRQEECSILLAEELRERSRDLSELAETLMGYLDIAEERRLTEDDMKVIKPSVNVLRKPEELKTGYSSQSPVTQCLVCLQYFVERLSVAIRQIVRDGETNADAMATELCKTAQDFLRRCKRLPSLPGGADAAVAGPNGERLRESISTANREAVIEAEQKLQDVHRRAERLYKDAAEELYKPFSLSPPTSDIFSKDKDKRGDISDRPREPWRLACEAEFVQCLANPIFLREMLKYLVDARFRRFLQYLKYWSDRRYSLLLTYPVCLQTLELLTSPQCAEALCRDPQAAVEVDRSTLRQWAQTHDRPIVRSYWCSDTSQEDLPRNFLPELPPPHRESVAREVSGPPIPRESLTEAATYAGYVFFKNANSAEFGAFSHIYTSYPLSGHTESLWKFEEVAPPTRDIHLEGIEAPTDPVLIDNRLPTPHRERKKQPKGELVDSRQKSRPSKQALTPASTPRSGSKKRRHGHR